LSVADKDAQGCRHTLLEVIKMQHFPSTASARLVMRIKMLHDRIRRAAAAAPG
jgi:hypothetical protein